MHSDPASMSIASDPLHCFAGRWERLPRHYRPQRVPLLSLRPRAMAARLRAYRGSKHLTSSHSMPLWQHSHNRDRPTHETVWYVQASTPPSSWYLSPEVFELEKLAIFHRNWLVSLSPISYSHAGACACTRMYTHKHLKGLLFCLHCMLLAPQLCLSILDLRRWWAMQARHPSLESTSQAPLPTSTMWWCGAMTTSCALSTMCVA